MKKILIDMPIDAKSLTSLQENPALSITTVEPSEDARLLPKEIVHDQEILFCTCPPTNISDMANLKFIQIASAGYTQLFDLGLGERKIHACNAAGVNDIPIAEWNIAMMVNLARDLRGMIRNQEGGIWDRDARFQGEIRGSTVGIWGYGGIGRETARLARNMGMAVYVLDAQKISPRDNFYVVSGTGDIEGVLPDRAFCPGQEKDFLSELDFLILSMPLTKRTEGIITEQYLKMLPSHAFVLNPARGPLINEQALIKALTEHWIAGAALDTHYHYPMPAEHPLWQFPNVIMTPHISGSTLSPCFLERIWDTFLQNVERYMKGKPLLNELTEAQLLGQ